MELAKLLVKIIYLVLIYGIVFNVLKMQTSLLNYKLDFLKNTPLKFIGASNLLAIRKNK